MEFLRRILAVSAGALVLLFSQMPARAQAPEYQVKAAMLYKFALFVEWPAKAFASSDSPFVVCVLGKDPFGPYLQQEVGEARVGTHPVEIRRMEKAENARGCHMVFISRSEESRLKQVLAPLRNTSVLIVSDTGDTSEFCRQGGMVGLVMDDGKVRFELNSKAAEQAGLKIDSRLKRIATSAECGEAP
ncbi:MAG TPA: YfiR family protein [Dissulfurispiraceae bacterium]